MLKENLNINALELIPQRPPMVLVDQLVYFDPVISKTRFVVTEESIFWKENRFSEYGILENIAQSCAARIGYINRSDNESIKIGYIGSIKDFEMLNEVEKDKEIETEIEVVNEVFDIVLVKARVSQNNLRIAHCEMKIALSKTPVSHE